MNKSNNFRFFILLILDMIFLIIISAVVCAENNKIVVKNLGENFRITFLAGDNSDCFLVTPQYDKIIVYDFNGNICTYDNYFKCNESFIYDCKKYGDYFYFAVKGTLDPNEPTIKNTTLELHRTKDFKNYELVKMMTGIPYINKVMHITENENIFTRDLMEEFCILGLVGDEVKKYPINFIPKNVKEFDGKLYFYSDIGIYVVDTKKGDVLNYVELPYSKSPYELINDKFFIDKNGQVYSIKENSFQKTDDFPNLSDGNFSDFCEKSGYIFYVYNKNEIRIYSKQLAKVKSIHLDFDVKKVWFTDTKAYIIFANDKELVCASVDYSDEIQAFEKEIKDNASSSDNFESSDVSSIEDKGLTSSESLNKKDKPKDKNVNKNKENKHISEIDEKSSDIISDCEKDSDINSSSEKDIISSDFDDIDSDPAKNKDFWFIPNCDLNYYKEESVNPLINNYLNKYTIDIKIDYENKIIYNITEGTTIGELIKYFSGKITLYGLKNSDDKIISSGDYVFMNNGASTEKYYLSVLGDLNNNGLVTTRDFELLFNFLSKGAELENEPIAFYSMDIKEDKKIDSGDMVFLMQYVYFKIIDNA